MFIQLTAGGSYIYINVNKICSVENGRFGTLISTSDGKAHQVSENMDVVMGKIKSAK